MSDQCFSEGCNKLVISGCTCDDSLMMCKDHAMEHFLSKDNHNLKKLYTKIDDQQRNNLLNFFVENIKINQINKQKIKTYTSQIINSIVIQSNMLIKEIKKWNNYFKQQIENTLKNSLVKTNMLDRFNSSKTSIIQPLVLDTEKIEKGVLGIFNIIMSQSTVNFENFVKIINEYSIHPQLDDDFAFYFETAPSSNVNLIDLNSYKKKTFKMQADFMGIYCMSCRIDNGKYFIYGGYYCTGELARIIDIKNKNIEYLPSLNIPKSIAGGCLYLEEVYIFGGCTPCSNNALIDCQKFNLRTRNWIPIESLPQHIYHTSACVFNSNIYVTGFHTSKIYKYDSIVNQFSNLNCGLVLATSKF